MKSLCKTCQNCFCCKIENVPGGSSSNITKVTCLINPSAFDNLVAGMYEKTRPYPTVVYCNHYVFKEI